MQNFGGKIRCIMGDVQVVNESLKSKFSFIHFVYNLMIGLSGKNIIWLSGKCLWTKEKETWVSANWPLNNWALGTTAVPGETNNKQFLHRKSQMQFLVMFIWTTTCLLTLLAGKRAYNQSRNSFQKFLLATFARFTSFCSLWLKVFGCQHVYLLINLNLCVISGSKHLFSI